MDTSPANDYSDFPDTRAAETLGGLATGHVVRTPTGARCIIFVENISSLIFSLSHCCLYSCLGVVGVAIGVPLLVHPDLLCVDLPFPNLFPVYPVPHPSAF